jgi:hypothetical protein
MKQPKEKANELVKKYYNYVSGWTTINKPSEPPMAQYEGDGMKIGRAIQCAIIAVEELIEDCNVSLNYWQEVKNELKQML